MEKDFKNTQLEEAVEKFRSGWNKETHDWIFEESSLYLDENTLIVAFSREYCVGRDETCHSMVYIFKPNENDRIYYVRTYRIDPVSTNPEDFVSEILSAQKSNNKITITVKMADKSEKVLSCAA
jgi:hypothetical protein